LAAMVRGACFGLPGRGALPVPRPGRAPLAVQAAPLRSARLGFDRRRAAAILHVRDPEQLTVIGRCLQELFGLTAAEAVLAAGLAEGKSIEELAAEQGVSMNTARTQLKSIFAKTGVHRQGQLISLILKSIS
jgi:DNA-binding CsgD family transcriptional regulator